MSDVARRKELCIKVIRSHLISCPRGLTLRQLERDYEASECQKLPYRNFGHTDLLSFLKSLPDVVRIDYQNGQIALYGIADESSQHIKNMVDHQRKKPRVRRPRLTVASRRHSSGSFAGCRVGFASALTRRRVFKVLQGRKSGISVPAFFDLFKKEVGFGLNPLRQGFRTVPDFFLSMPDVCRLEYGRKDRSGNDLYIYPPKISEAPSRRPESQQKTKQDPPETEKSQDTNTSKPVVKSKSDVIRKPTCAQDSTTKATAVKPTKDVKSPPVDKCSSEEKIFNEPVVPSVQLLRTEILEILSEETEGVWAAKVPVLYKKKYGKDLEMKKLGYFSIIEFLSTLSDEVSITRPNPKGDWMLMKRHKGSSGRKKSSLDIYFDDNLQVTLMEIKELLIKSGDGIPAEKLCDMYERVYRHKIDLDEGDGAQAIMSLVMQIKGVCIFQEEGKFLITLTEKEKKAMRCLVSSSSQSHLPVDCVCPNVSYKQQRLPSSDTQYIDVFVADVTNPEYFTVQICGKKTTGALDELMDGLEKLYCSREGDKYKFPRGWVKIGQICAAVFMEDLNWYRAVIVQVYDDSEHVDVLYVDYGSVSSVPVESLRLLRSSFMLLPVQMIKARLAHIKPRNLTSWTLEARNCMLDMCRDRPIVGMITGIKDRVLSLCLCDTTKPGVDLHINDTLVEMKHAVFFPDGLKYEQAETLRRFLLQQIEAEKKGKVADFNKPVMSILSSHERNQDSGTPDICTNENETLGPSKSQVSLGNPVVLSGNTEEDPSQMSSRPPLRRYIRKYSVLGEKFSLHVINYEGHPMVASFEISLLFRQSSDVLRPLLLMKNLDFTEIFIGNDDKHAPLFDAIQRHNVPGSKENGLTRNLVCLYRLQDIPRIVQGLGHADQRQLISDVVKIIANFDGEAKFWFTEDDALSMEEDDGIEKLRKQLDDLGAQRKMLIEQLANESCPTIVDQVVTVERKICDVEGKISKHATNPSESRSNKVCDASVNQYGAQAEPVPEEANFSQVCAKNDTIRIAEVAPYVETCEKKNPVEEELSVIPGAHIHHEVNEFTPGPRNIITASEPPPLLVSGATGTANWSTPQMQNIVMDQRHSMQQIRVQDGFNHRNIPFVPQSTNSSQVTHSQIGLSQWQCVPIQQPQQMNNPQLFRDANGQVYVQQVGHSGTNTMGVPHSGLLYATNRGMTLQPAGPFPPFHFMPVPGMH